HPPTVELVLLLVEAVHQVAGAAARRGPGTRRALRRDVVVDRERPVAEVAGVRESVGRRVRAAGRVQWRRRQARIVLVQAAVRRTVLADLDAAAGVPGGPAAVDA